MPTTRGGLAEESGRPEVIVDFEYEDGLVFIAVQNIGSKPAHDVSVKFDKIITGVGGKRMNSIAVFRELSYLPPGKKIRAFVDAFHSYVARKQPLRVSAVVGYRGEGETSFRGRSTHNLAVYVDLPEPA